MVRVVENRYVFKACLKAFFDKSGDRNAGGRLFQVVGLLKNRPQNDLLCVEWDVKLYTLTLVC